MGRKPLEINGDMVERLAGIGCTCPEIGDVLGCSHDTLERRFSVELQRGRGTQKASLRRLQWSSAKRGNIAMQIWLGKQLLGQRDKQDVATRDESPRALRIVERIVATRAPTEELTDDELAGIARRGQVDPPHGNGNHTGE